MGLLSNSSNILRELMIFVRDHYIELAIFGVLLVVVWSVKRWWKFKQRRWLAILVLTLTIILFMRLILALITQYGVSIPQVRDLEKFLDAWKNNLNLSYFLATIIMAYLTYHLAKYPPKSEVRSSFPFDWFTTDDSATYSLDHHINTLKRQLLGEPILPYLARSGTSGQVEMFESLNSRKLVIIGRRGLGKTREAIETIERIAQKKGEPVTVLVPRGYLEIPFEFPKEIPLRNSILLINDVHEYFSHLSVREDTDEQTQRHFHDRLMETVRIIEKALEPRDFRVIMTAIDEPSNQHGGIQELMNLNKDSWPGFETFHMPSLDQTILLSFIRKVANFYNLEIRGEVERYIKSQSDLTCAGIIIPFKQEHNPNIRKELTLHEAEKYCFTYPQDWEEQVYKRVIEPFPQRKYVFTALCILQQAKLTAYRSLVIDLAAKLWKGHLSFLVKRRIRHAVYKELSGLVYEVRGIIYCPSVYLEGKGELEKSIPLVSMALKSELKNRASLLIPQLLGFIYHVGIDLNQHHSVIDTIKSATNHHRDDPRLWYYLSVIYGRTGNYEGAIRAANKACKIEPGFIEARRSLALNYSFQGQYLIALEIAEKLVNETNQARDWSSLSIILGKAGNFTESLEAAERAYSIDPYLIGVWHRLSVAYWNLGKKEASLSWTHKIARTTNYARDWYNLSVAYGLCGKYTDGVNAARKALEINPRFIEATYSLTTNLGTLHQHDEAIRLLLSVTDDKHNAKYWYYLSVAYGRAEEYEKAIEAAKAAIELDSKLTEAWRSLSLAYENLDRLPDKVEPLRQIAEQTNEVEDWYNLSVTLGKINDHDGAIEAAKKVLAIDPSHIEALRTVGIRYGLLGNHLEAIDALRRVVELTKDSNDWKRLSAAYNKASLYQDARYALKAAQSVAQSTIKLPVECEKVYNQILLHHNENALSFAKQLAVMCSRDVDTLLSISKGLMALDRYKEACIFLLLATDENPENVVVWQSYSIALDWLGGSEELVRVARKLVALKGDSVQSRAQLAIALMDAGHPTEAFDLIKELILTYPDRHQSWHAAGLVYQRDGQYDEAIEALSKAITISKNKAYLWYTLGNTHSLEKQYSDAKDAYLRATKLNPVYTKAWYKLGNIYLALEEMEQAKEAYKKAIECDPFFEKALAAIEKLNT